MQSKLKAVITFLASLVIVGGVFFIIGMAGSVDTDKLSLSDFAFYTSLVVAGMIIAVLVINKITDNAR